MDSNRIRHRATTFTAGLLIGGVALAAAAASPTPPPLAQLALREDAPPLVKVFAQLNEPSVGELNTRALKATGALASRKAQQQQAARINAQQQAIRMQLEPLGAKVVNTLRLAANGLYVAIPPENITALRSMQGVLNVMPVPIAKPETVDSVRWIGAPEVWATRQVKGKHIKIGIIDTGVDYTHANFGGSGRVEDYAKIDPNVVTPGTFPTAKVTGGIDLAGSSYRPGSDPAAMPVPDGNPFDLLGHGSHVAGIAAGVGVPGLIHPGVAPEAEIYAVKVTDDQGNGTDLVAPGIEWALDPNRDFDMSDRLDVINLSLGDLGGPTTPDSIAAERASALGIVVVAAAGNAGLPPYITVSPGNAPSVISVASTIPGGRLYSRISVAAPQEIAGLKNNVEGAGPPHLRNVGPISEPLVKGSPDDGCTPLTNGAEVAGHIALIRIGGACRLDFTKKYLAAQAAGARAIVVYEERANPPSEMFVFDASIRIPGVMIGSADGLALAAVATPTAASPVHVTLDVAPDPAQDDLISTSSARGPGPGGTLFKPDIAAPGVNIVSTDAGAGTLGQRRSGTSMAAPHVAGAAALLRELHPGVPPAAIKALLQNSTVDANPSGDTAIARQGAGVVRIDRAAALESYATPGGFSFGRLNPESPITQTQTVTLHDFSGRARSFTGKHVPRQTYPGVTVDCPSVVTVGANQSSPFQVKLSFDPSVAPTRGVFENWLRSETEVDGSCDLVDGKDTLRVSYLASVDAAALMFAHNLDTNRVRITNSGASAGLAQAFTLVSTARDRATNDSGSTITHLGARHAMMGSKDTLQFALALGRTFENFTTLSFTMTLDIDGDAVNDVLIDGGVSRAFPDPFMGFVTRQVELKEGGGFIDIDQRAQWDFNDRVAVIPFTSTASGGFVPDKFSYTLTVRNHTDGSNDTIKGTVDMTTQAVVPDLNDFTLNPSERIDVGFSRAGNVLWIYPGNPPEPVDRQVQVIAVKAANP